MADHNLTINGSDHFHDSSYLVLTVDYVALEVGVCYHEHYVDALGVFADHYLVIAGCWHDHVAMIATEMAFGITIKEAYHEHVSDAPVLTGVFGTLIGTDPLDPPWLPTLMIEAQSGIRITCYPEEGIPLPGLELEIRPGSKIEGNLPDLRASGTMTYDTLMSLDEKLPVMSAEGYFAARADDEGKLPDLRVDMSIVGDLRGTINQKLPALEISATGWTAFTGQLAKDLPALEISASMVGIITGQLVANLPALKIEAGILPGAVGTLEANLPTLKMQSGEATVTTMSIVATLPTLLSGSVGSGSDSGGVGGDAITMQDESRFTDYVLRHSRF
jgi:hypothetical protein